MDRPSHRLRFSLAGLMASIAVCALLLTMWRAYVLSYQAELDRMARITALGDSTDHHGQVGTEPRGQFFFRQFLGEKLSHRAVYVHLVSNKVDDVWLRDNLRDLQYIEHLTISSPNVSDHGLLHLAGLKSLKALILDGTQVTDCGIVNLQEDLPGLMRVAQQP